MYLRVKGGGGEGGQRGGAERGDRGNIKDVTIDQISAERERESGRDQEQRKGVVPCAFDHFQNCTFLIRGEM
jgi:hypothetical protein